MFGPLRHGFRSAGLFREGTARQRAEDELRASEATNRAILAAIPDLMLRISRDGVYIDANLNGNRGLTPPWNAIVGHRMQDVFPLRADAETRMNAKVWLV